MGGSQRIGWTMFFTEKHMVKNSHRFCGGLRGGQQGEAQREIYLLNALGEYLRYNKRPTSIQPLGKTRKDRRNAKLNVPVTTLHRFKGKKDASTSLEWEAHLQKAR